MWAAIGGLFTLIVMVLKLWADNASAKEAELNAIKKEISNAVASGDAAAINAAIQRLRN